MIIIDPTPNQEEEKMQILKKKRFRKPKYERNN